MELFTGRLIMSSTVLILVSVTVIVNSYSHHIRHHRDRFKRQQGAHLYLPGSYVTDNNDPDAGPWEEWSGPSACSRTCGGGVSTQYRRCTPGYTCQGPTKRHFSCNTQDCDEPSDYRAQQCSEFDRIPFEGVTYQWVPYKKGPNKCELNCMPRGERFYYRHKLHVEDGTRCSDDKLDVCIQGKCYPVGCDMMIGSPAAEDKCRVCGGDGSNCNTVTGRLDMQDLPMGYNDILLIPAGATNINIREVAPSNNYLAVRNTSGHYHLNGNWRINFSRTLRFAGCDFNYNRYPQGFPAPDTITCLGPTDEPLFIVLLQQDRNVGVDYEYSVPQNIITSTLNETYAWTFDQFTPCTSSCGGGIQYRNVSCAGRRSLEPVDPSLCDPTTRPSESQRCGEMPCDARWVAKPWEKCSAPCGVGGTQRRQILCEQVIAKGVASIVDEEQCAAIPKPADEQACNKGEICAEWHIGRWKPCDHLCGEGKQMRNATCFRKENGKIIKLDDSQCPEEKPETEKACNLRPCEGVDWVTSDWSGCDKCGLNLETRRVQCATAKGEVHSDDLCEAEDKPEAERKCTTEPKFCDFEWYASQWSQCSAKCGKGVKTRKVFCASIEDLQKVEDSKCDEAKKYENSEECEADTDKCTGEWFSGPWSQCSKECGGGEMTRKIICMRNNDTVAATECGPDTIPSGSETCNTHSCDEDEVLPVDVTKPVDVTDDTEPSKEYSDSIEIVTTPAVSETEDDGDFEIVESDECDDGEWIEEDADEDEDMAGSTPMGGSSDTTDESTKSSDESTESSLASDDLMLSDSTGTGEEVESTSVFTSETGSGEGDTTVSEPFTDEGSGDTDSTISGVSDLTDSSTDASSDGSTISGATDSSTDVSSDGSTDSSGGTDATDATDSSSDVSGITDATDTSATDATDTTDASASTDDQTTDSSATDSSDKSTDATESTISGATDSSSDTSDLSSDVTTDSSVSTESRISSSDVTETTDSTETTETTESTESTESTQSSDMTENTVMTSDSSATTDTSDSTTDGGTTESSGATTDGFTDFDAVMEGDLFETTPEVSKGTEVTDDTSDGSSVTSDGSTDVTGDGLTDATSDGTTDVTSDGSTDVTGDGSTDVTVDGSTDATSDGTSDSGATTSSEMDSSITTDSSSDVTESTDSTISTEESSDLTTESSDSSTDSTESTTEVSTDSTVTEETESTVSTEYDIWSSTTESSTEYGKSDITDIFKPKVRKCKRRKQKSCKESKFGCCYDQITPAEGPFGKGCPTPKTCEESKFGCCEDGVSQALGKNFKGCPSTHCDETLFGCCDDKKTPAEGENKEGCPPPPPACLKSKYGCCPDNTTNAKKKGDTCEDKKEGEEDCTNTTFGCCPDGKTAATGEDNKGCGAGKCAESTYGCCPDGSTSAKGPNYKGCDLPCGDTMFGCCEDRSTPAHGYSREGCCLSSAYGCCPDNIKPADGPNNEGCGCEYSPYRCCPDNITPARGYNNEGCGCQYSEHGCCPDNQTPAKGPEFEGCSCHSFQFGCCPDGVTIVKGPHQQGCSCRESEFGCCGDEETPAKGPDGQGCSCAESKYGCCLDGVTEAKGDNFDGCEEAPVDLQAGCSESKEAGTCYNYTVKWYFDMEYGGCTKFWYGGCDGNNNRFSSNEECRDICVEPKGKDRCKLPKVVGLCEGYYPKWYYDKEHNHCAQFVYGGCLGNNNNFETVEECTKECVVDSRVDPCELPMEQGPCRGQYLRWYYDKESSRCQQFYYGGCQTNGNNFATEMACSEKCSLANRKKEVCEMPKSEGNCTGREAKWYHDTDKMSCMPFYYTGCEGNKNNFDTVEECETICPTESKKDTCQLPAETGSCANYVQRWYYDTREKTCRQFYYGGCDGNGNNFQSEQECLQRCEAKQETPPPPPPYEETRPEYRPEPQTEFRTDFCFYPSDSGPCRNTTEGRWFYDRDGVCKQFAYGGCGGNENNFMTEEECNHKCENAQDLCTLPQVVGPCTSFSQQYYHDYSTNRCEPFMYGGCAGNANRFESLEACQAKCISSTATVAPPPEYPVVPEPQEYDDVAVCFYDADPGNCNENHHQYFYDAQKQECSTFEYSGCGGNVNRFFSIEACERKCGRYRGQEVCRFPQDTGPCRASISKFFFNTETGRCEEFIYGGCEGNGNRFSTIDECKSMCEKEEQPAQRPNITNQEICYSPVDVGRCDGEQGSHKRWYFDNDRGECIAFIYSGCGGNYNQFTSSQACVETCSQFMNYPVEPDPYQPEHTNEVVEDQRCEVYTRECQEMRCQYGLRAFVDESLCNRCACYDPCEGHSCQYDQKCAVEVNYNRTSEEEDTFIAVCRKDEKPGICPTVSSDHRDCPRECNSDVECPFDLKCCSVGCGMSCLAPQMPAEMVTSTYQPAYTEPPVYNEYYPPHLDHEEYEPEVTAREGEVANLRCAIRGNPNPKFSWMKDNLLIDGKRAKYRILLDGTLQVITVHKSDSGIYLCVADNSIGKPLQNEVRLNVTDGVNFQAKVLDIPEEESSVVVSLGSSTTLNCYAYGFPFPSVTWWRNDQMVPLKTSQYEQRKDFSLHINRVELSNLGVYTCQAYNGVGKATSWLVSIHTPGPVESSDPQDKEYLKYVIDYNARPEVPKRPQVQVRPPYRISPSPSYPKPSPPPKHFTRPDRYPPAQLGKPYTVPVKVNISLPETTFDVGSDINIPCDVEGYPIPHVQWYKDDVPLQRSDKISISESNRIYIKKTEESDSGTYKCEAYNQYSRSQSSVSITVKVIRIPASCTDNEFLANCGLIVRAKACQHKYYARFCCKSCMEAGQLHPEMHSNLV